MSTLARVYCFTVLLMAAVVTVPANAQKTVILVTESDYSLLHTAGQEDFGNDAHKKKAKSVVMIIKCEHYTAALVTYDDGSLRRIDLAGAKGNAVDRTELAAYQQALPNLQVVDGGC